MNQENRLRIGFSCSLLGGLIFLLGFSWSDKINENEYKDPTAEVYEKMEEDSRQRNEDFQRLLEYQKQNQNCDPYEKTYS